VIGERRVVKAQRCTILPVGRQVTNYQSPFINHFEEPEHEKSDDSTHGLIPNLDGSSLSSGAGV
jgi:hypothetical protein